MERLDTIIEVRTAPGVTSLSGRGYPNAMDDFATEIAAVCAGRLEVPMRLAVERVDASGPSR